MTNDQFKKLLPELTANYHPGAEAAVGIANVRLIIIIGPSGVGKTTLMKKLNIPYVAGDTSRPARPGDVDGVDYRFRQDYEQLIKEIKDGKFLQVAIGPAGDLYASSVDSYPKQGDAIGAVVADAVPVFRNLGFESTLSIFIVPPSYSEWMRRMGSHNLKDEQLMRRLAEAKRSFSFALKDKQTHFVLNDDIDKSAHRLEQVISGKILDNEETARQIAQEIFAKLTSIHEKG